MNPDAYLPDVEVKTEDEEVVCVSPDDFLLDKTIKEEEGAPVEMNPDDYLPGAGSVIMNLKVGNQKRKGKKRKFLRGI